MIDAVMRWPARNAGSTAQPLQRVEIDHPRMTRLAFIAWFGICIWGFYVISVHAATPGAPARSPAQMVLTSTEETAVSRVAVLFIHPRCPCVAATIDVLSRMSPVERTSCRFLAVFVWPEDASLDWAESPYWDDIAAIPGVYRIFDVGGGLARAFGARTSGQVLLLGPNGQLSFSGGITGLRGHAGYSAAEGDFRAHLRDATLPSSTQPVFGCALFSLPDDTVLEES